jgi:hypothetical protein
MMIVGTFLLLGMAIGLALAISRAILSALFVLLGLAQPLIIRWHLVAFGAMLFWSWFFAPTLAAI